jgi:hypothetical protein
MKVPEQYRLKDHYFLKSDSSYGNNGFFVIPHYKISLYFFQCQVSDGLGWQHVSISLIKEHINRKKEMVNRCPTWEEMCFIKSIFWDDEEPVMQLHPPKSQWVNNHPYCLHLWKPNNIDIPLPLSIMVGNKNFNIK